MQTPEVWLSGQAEPDRCLCHATRVIIPKARRLPANNTAAHSWPEISSPKHPRHVPASVSHPSGFHPPSAVLEEPKKPAPPVQTDALARGLALSLLQGPLRDTHPTEAREEGFMHPEKWAELQVILPTFQSLQAGQTHPTYLQD